MSRIAHVLRKYDPAQWGGTETHVAEVTRRLARRGWEVEVHAPRGPRTSDRTLGPEVTLERYRAFLPFVGSREQRRALVANAGNIASLTEPLWLAADRGLALAHVHTQGRIGGGVRTAMRLTGRPYVVSVHGPLLAHRDWLRAETRTRHQRVLDLGKPIGALLGSRRVVDDAARVITFNEQERRALAERIGDRAVRMDHGVHTERLASGDAQRARRRWPELAGGPVVALVGRVARQKNQLLAVRAFARGAPSDHRLVFAGSITDPGYREKAEAEARALGVADRVCWLGNVDAAQGVPDLMALARLLVVPSTHEAFGLAVLEGWAARRPVLFPDHSGLADIARALGDPSAVVDGLDVEAWSSAMARMLDSAACRAAAARAGDELVRRRYCWEAVTDRLSHLYAQVLDENARRPAAAHRTLAFGGGRFAR